MHTEHLFCEDVVRDTDQCWRDLFLSGGLVDAKRFTIDS